MSENFLGDVVTRTGDRPRTGTYFDVIFFVIVLLASGFSSYTTYLGFSYDIPAFMAFVLAAIIGLGLFAINFLIRDARREDTGLTKPFIAFFIVFVFSFISNTNAIYTFFLERDIVGQTQETAWRVFDSESAKILTEIDNNEHVRQFETRRTAFETARRNLEQQITDERNPGLGTIARVHLGTVETLLGTPLTPLQPPPPTAPMASHRAYATKLDGLIEQQARGAFENDPATPMLKLSQKIRKLHRFYEDEIRRKAYDSNTTDLMKRDLNQIGVEARNLLLKEIDLQDINNTSDEIGSFQYTWTNFLNWISPAAIILSILLGTLLDILAPLFSVLLYRSDVVF